MKRHLFAGLAAAAALSAGTVIPATTASAAPVTAQSCLGSATNYTGTPGSGGGNAHWPGTGKWAYATKKCADINLKVNYTRQVRTCFKSTGKCNGWRTANKGKWALAATNMRDGAGFYLQFRGANRSTGKIAY
ncbi:hypothetical protein AB0D04_36380 [Streptomyces sp. NPDC048483]|uniref:hypothetical protein n=1 Tax=Streptomyces sp. NPDC048483 TaxID=3154927 RepID=UPI003448CCF4